MTDYPEIEGCTENEVKLLCDLTTAISEAIRETTAGSGQPMVKIDILHAALGANLERTFAMMPDNQARADYLFSFCQKLAEQVGKQMLAAEPPVMPEGVILQ